MATATRVLAAVAAFAVLTGCAPRAGLVTGDASTAAAPAPGPAAAAGPVPAYDRDTQFGGWIDTDRDGCNTKAEVVARDSGATCPPRAASRTVTITDPYTGEQVVGWSEIDGEHVVALRDVYDAGAWAWTRAQRVAFANDTMSRIPGCPRCSQVVAAGDNVNQSKSDADPTEWPTARQRIKVTPAGRCFHARTYLAVIDHYAQAIPGHPLVLPAAKRTAINRIIAANCQTATS